MKSQGWLWSSVVVVGTVGVLAAQTAKPTFEVASVKKNVSGAATASGLAQSQTSFDVASIKLNTSGRMDGAYEVRPDGVTVTNYPLREMIARVYGIPLWLPVYLTGGPDVVLMARFDIQAKGSQRMSPDEVATAMKGLLAERFRLQIRKVLLPTQVYALTVLRKDRFGPELRPSTIDCTALIAKVRAERDEPLGVVPIGIPPPRDAKNRPVCWGDQIGAETPPPGAFRRRRAGPLSELVRSINGTGIDRPVIDGTGLSGLFEWQLDFRLGMAILPDSAVPPLPIALEEQLGLRLEPRTAPLEVHVIDRLEMPTPN